MTVNSSPLLLSENAFLVKIERILRITCNIRTARLEMLLKVWAQICQHLASSHHQYICTQFCISVRFEMRNGRVLLLNYRTIRVAQNCVKVREGTEEETRWAQSEVNIRVVVVRNIVHIVCKCRLTSLIDALLKFTFIFNFFYINSHT